MSDEDEPDIEFHFVPSRHRTLEDITRRLQEMQRELEQRAPLGPQDEDDEEPAE